MWTITEQELQQQVDLCFRRLDQWQNTGKWTHELCIKSLSQAQKLLDVSRKKVRRRIRRDPESIVFWVCYMLGAVSLRFAFWLKESENQLPQEDVDLLFLEEMGAEIKKLGVSLA